MTYYSIITYCIMEGIALEKISKKFRYGVPIESNEVPKPRKRLPQYDECLREFVDSGYDNWKVDMSTLPSQKPRVVLSSLKWRIKNKSEFGDIQAIMNNKEIYLTKGKQP